ncbi:DUF3299 domain-containing protein [Solimonas marina]|uniref:DUF3299 domain-containing protein n=1 Tax=Solimonas marina TaxID=2714601 RepID=A0A970B8D6_9GAMM|nr:DUF3299 domain-containing protein [Solimonas marina]NKF21276.1 DUF3299 domain-containing protein [Solimonas marina]
MPGARISIALLLTAALAACGRHDEPTGQPPAPPTDKPATQTAQTDWTLAATPDVPPATAQQPTTSTPSSASHPIVRYYNGKLVEDHSAPVLEIQSEFDNHRNGKLAVPAFPGDIVYLYASLQTEAGTPLKNVAVSVRSKRGTPYVLMADHTDAQGDLEFRLIAGPLGADLITVSAAGARQDFYLDVSAPTRKQWLGGLDLHGTTSWDLLMSARLDMQRDLTRAVFPAPLQALDRQRIRIAGFMVPLGLDEKQTHFLLSANPPSCFFHPPGGPASAMEVFAPAGVAMTYEPMVLEGQLELHAKSQDSILYRLRSARLVSTIKR